ncbi:MAG: RNA polymerase sigma-70 factor [Dysgonamonadaceae bacterium]|nr:RNA polymerase sigma-70 factor [Dysgonamonadaceae bacterium]
MLNKDSITSHREFSRIYVLYFPKMVRFAREYVISEEEAKNIVQDLFLYLWEQRETLNAISNLNAFLFTLIKNRCIDYYRRYNRFESKKESLDNIRERELHLRMEALRQFDVNMFSTHEIEEILDKAIQNLPEKCRQVFVLSRMEGLKHEEIACRLDISVNTVQNHISTALRKLKVELKDFLPLFVFII